MGQITIPLSMEKLGKLQELAARLGVSPDDLARAGLDDFLERPNEDFARALERVLKKNAEPSRASSSRPPTSSLQGAPSQRSER